MKGNLTDYQKQEFLDLIRIFSPLERKILIYGNIGREIDYHKLWVLCHIPELRFGLRAEHHEVMRVIALESGYHVEEIERMEGKLLRKIRHPFRSNVMRRILQVS